MTPVIKERYDLDEKEFYRIYFNILNIKLEKKLTPQEIEVLVILCSKPMNFYLDSKRSANHKSKKYEIAEELKVNKTVVYGFLNGLVKKGLLIKKSDDFMELPQPIQTLRNTIKQNLKKGSFTFDYTFNFTINDNRQNRTGD